jgi:ADP-heptose:LPS heptosyltransferase
VNALAQLIPCRILVVPLRFIGDTILTVPLLRNLKHHYPDAAIDVLASKTSAPLLEPCPYLNQVVIEAKGTPARLDQLRAGRYDLVIILRKSVTMAAMCRLAGIRHVVGYDKQRWFKPLDYKRWGVLLDAAVRYPSLRTQTPQAVSHLGMLTPLGKVPINDHLELWTTEADETAIQGRLEALFSGKRPPSLAVLHTVSASHGKSFAIEQFVEAVQQLNQLGLHLICTGTPGDRPLYDQLAQLSGVSLTNWAGETTLRETVALYRRTEIIVTVDSSPIHLAAAAGVPHIVGVFGPTNEVQWGPHSSQARFRPVFLDLPCRPCYAKICSHNSCRLQLPASAIARAVQELSQTAQGTA